MKCVLCYNTSDTFFIDEELGISYFKCSNCELVFLNPQNRLTELEEKNRYDLHDCGFDDPGYIKFVSPLLNFIQKNYKAGADGLDFGCGRDQTLRKFMETSGFQISVYDSFYFPNNETLQSQYDFVTACEVVEHLFEPDKVFQTLRAVLKPGADLVIMTSLFTEKIKFASWHYRRDPTHVSFYSPKTFEWIKTKYGFSEISILTDRLVVLTVKK